MRNTPTARTMYRWLAVAIAVGMLMNSANAPAEIADADYGRDALHCLNMFHGGDPNSSMYLYVENKCSELITVFYCFKDGYMTCGEGVPDSYGNEPDISHFVHNQNPHFTHQYTLKPKQKGSHLVRNRAHPATNEVSGFAACFGQRAGMEWFTSSMDGSFQCHPKRSSESASVNQETKSIDRPNEEIRQLQIQLAELGYDPGPPDGVWGPRTQRAYDAWVSEGKPGRQSTDEATVPTPKTADLWGSIAFSQDPSGGYTWAIVWNSSGAEQAKQAGLEVCQREGGESCQDVGWFRNACGALALGDGNGFGTGGGETTDKAERAALERCRVSNRNCRIEVSRCSDRQNEVFRVARSPGKKEPNVAHEAIEGTLKPKCDEPEGREGPWSNCWKEFANIPDCHFWHYGSEKLGDVRGVTWQKDIFWTGNCIDAKAEGEGTIWYNPHGHRHESTGRLVNGKKEGHWSYTFRSDPLERDIEVTFVDGKPHGTYIENFRYTDGSYFSSTEVPMVDGERHGRLVGREKFPFAGRDEVDETCLCVEVLHGEVGDDYCEC